MRRCSSLLSVTLLFTLLTVAAGCAAPTSDDDELDSQNASMTADDDQNPESPDSVTEEDIQRGLANAAGMEDPDPVNLDDANAADDPVLQKYAAIDPTNVIPKKLRDEALRYFDKNKSRFPNGRYITVINMTAHSKDKRYFIVNMSTGAVERHPVAHGLNSDPENDGTPRLFSNTPESKKTSLGFYKTAETFNGKYGHSMRLDGLSTTNSNARRRAIIFHGAPYVEVGRSKQGRSWGCPAVPMNVKDSIISKTKGGSLMYIGLTN